MHKMRCGSHNSPPLKEISPRNLEIPRNRKDTNKDSTYSLQTTTRFLQHNNFSTRTLPSKYFSSESLTLYNPESALATQRTTDLLTVLLITLIWHVISQVYISWVSTRERHHTTAIDLTIIEAIRYNTHSFYDLKWISVLIINLHFVPNLIIHCTTIPPIF